MAVSDDLPKLSSLKVRQWEWWPDLQTAQELQKAKERRTGSPGLATVTPGPMDLT